MRSTGCEQVNFTNFSMDGTGRQPWVVMRFLTGLPVSHCQNDKNDWQVLAACEILFDHLIEAILNRDWLISAPHARQHVTEFTRRAFGCRGKEGIKRTLIGSVLPDADVAFAADHFRFADFGFDFRF